MFSIKTILLTICDKLYTYILCVWSFKWVLQNQLFTKISSRMTVHVKGLTIPQPHLIVAGMGLRPYFVVKLATNVINVVQIYIFSFSDDSEDTTSNLPASAWRGIQFSVCCFLRKYWNILEVFFKFVLYNLLGTAKLVKRQWVPSSGP